VNSKTDISNKDTKIINLSNTQFKIKLLNAQNIEVIILLVSSFS